MQVGLIGIGSKGATTVHLAADTVRDDELFAVTALKSSPAPRATVEAADQCQFISDDHIENDEKLNQAIKQVVLVAIANTDFAALVVDSSREWARVAGRIAIHLLDLSSAFGGTMHTALYLIGENDRMSDKSEQFNAELGMLSDSECYIDRGMDFEAVGQRLGLFYGAAWYSDKARRDIEWVAQPEGFVLGHTSPDMSSGVFKSRINGEFDNALEEAVYHDLTAEVGAGSGRRTLVVLRVPHRVVIDKRRVKRAVDKIIDTDARIVFIRNEAFDDIDIIVARG